MSLRDENNKGLNSAELREEIAELYFREKSIHGGMVEAVAWEFVNERDKDKCRKFADVCLSVVVERIKRLKLSFAGIDNELLYTGEQINRALDDVLRCFEK